MRVPSYLARATWAISKRRVTGGLCDLADLSRAVCAIQRMGHRRLRYPKDGRCFGVREG